MVFLVTAMEPITHATMINPINCRETKYFVDNKVPIGKIELLNIPSLISLSDELLLTEVIELSLEFSTYSSNKICSTMGDFIFSTVIQLVAKIT